VCLFNCEFNVDLGLPLNTRPAQSLPKVDGIPEQPDTEFDWGKVRGGRGAKDGRSEATTVYYCSTV